MAEKLGVLGHVLNSAVTVASRGRLGVEVNPIFTSLEKSFKWPTKYSKIVYGSGTQIIIDDKNQRLVTKYHVYKRTEPVVLFSSKTPNQDRWNVKSPKTHGKGTFLEATGESLDQRMSSGDELL